MEETIKISKLKTHDLIEIGEEKYVVVSINKSCIRLAYANEESSSNNNEHVNQFITPCVFFERDFLIGISSAIKILDKSEFLWMLDSDNAHIIKAIRHYIENAEK